jgi:hypothetical protein
MTFSPSKINYPKTEGACIAESKELLAIVKKADYLDRLEYLKNYENFKNYTEKDFEKAYRKLHEYLATKEVSKLHLLLMRDTLSIVGLDGKVSFLELSYLDKNVVPERNIATMEYSFSEEEGHYTLTYFKHSLNPKVAPILPNK